MNARRALLAACVLAAASVFAGSDPAVKRLEIDLDDDRTLLPYRVILTEYAAISPDGRPIGQPLTVVKPALFPGDSALVIYGYNASSYSDNPSSFTFSNFTRGRIIDDNPVRMTITDYRLSYGETVTDVLVVAAGFRRDSAFVAVLSPFVDVVSWLYLTSGVDRTGDGKWTPGVAVAGLFDYDFDGRVEAFVQVNAGRDLTPRELFCVEIDPPAVEWSLPVATAAGWGDLYPCGDSADPGIIFASYNPKQGVSDSLFSDSWAYVTVVDHRGQVRLHRVIASDHGHIHMLPTTSPREFLIAHEVPFVAPQDTLQFPPNDFRVTRLGIDGAVIAASPPLPNPVQSMWPPLQSERSGGLWAITTDGRVLRLNEQLKMTAMSEPCGLRNRMATIPLPDQPDSAWVISSGIGTVLMSKEMEQLAFFGSGGFGVYDLIAARPEEESNAFVGQTGQRVYVAALQHKVISAYLQDFIHGYRAWLLGAVFLLLVLLVLINYRRVKTLQRLRRREADFLAFCDASPDLLFRIDANGVIRDYRTTDPSRLLVPPEKFLNRPLRDWAPPELADQANALIRKTLETHSMQTMHYDAEQRGERRFWEVRFAPTGENEVFAVVRDITDRVTVERSLRDSEERFRTLVANVPSAIFRARTDEARTMDYISDTIATILGHPAESFLQEGGRRYINSVHPEDRTRLQQKIAEVVGSRAPYSVEYRVLDHRGGIRWVHERGQAVFGDGSRARFIDGSIHDITERKLAEQTLRESEEKARAQFNGIPVPTYTWKADGGDFVLSDYNTAAAEITGGGIAALVGVRCSELYASRKEILEDMRQCHRTRQPVVRQMGYSFQTTGRTAELLVHYVYVPPNLVIAHTVDITANYEYEQELARRLRYEAGLAACSQTLLHGPYAGDTLDQALTHLLRAIEACRVYLYENFEDPELGLCARQTHEVCREGVSRLLAEPSLQRVAYVPKFQKMHDLLASGQPAGSVVAEMGPHGRAVNDRYGIQSTLNLPVFVGGRWFGFVGFDDTLSPRRWSDEDIRLLRTAATMIGSYLDMLRANTELVAERDFSRSLLQTANSLVVCLDEQARITVFNDELERVTGYRREEVMGTNWNDRFIPQRYHHPGLADFGAWIRQHPADRYERELLTRSGEERIILWSNSILENPHTGQVTAIAIGHDVTDRRRVQMALADSESNFRAFFETIADMIVVANPEGHILLANGAVERKLGYSAEELRRMHLRDLHPEDRRGEADEILAAMFRGEQDSCPLPLARKNGGLVPVESRIWFGQWDGAGCMFALIKDLSAEREAQQRFERLFRSNPALMALSSISDQRFVDVNDTWLATLGYARSEVFGRTPTELGLFADPSQFADAGRILRSTGQLAGYELQVRRRDGVILDGLFSGEVIIGQSQQYILTVMIDITERKRAEAALSRSEEKYRAVMEQTGDNMYLAELGTGVILEANPALCRLLGYSRGEMDRMTVFDFIDHERPDIETRMREAQAGKLKFLAERYYRTRDGRRIPVEVGINTVSYGGRQVLCIVSRDISERKRAEQALREQEAKYRLLVENVRAAIILVDYEGRFLFANENAARAAGHTAGDLIGKLQWEVFPKDLADRQMENVRRVIREDREYISEAPIFLKGEWRWFYNNLQPYHDASGRTTAALVIAHDITAARLAQQALRESEERFREMADLLPQTIFETDDKGKLLYINRHGYESVGYSPEDLQNGLYADQFFLEEDRPQMWADFADLLHGLPQKREEYLHVRRDGSTFPVLIYTSRIMRDGAPVGLRGCVIDITERKRAEEEVRRANQERYRQLREIAGGVSHEIYNSLYPAVVSLDKLRSMLPGARPADPPRVERLLGMTEMAVRRAISLTESVTHYSRLDSHNQPEQIGLAAAIEEIIQMYGPRLEEDGIDVTVDVPEDLTVAITRTHAHSLFNNLFINAVDALTESKERRIEIHAGQQDERVRIAIHDTGPGIPFEAVQRIFEPFFTTKPGRGTGLGLAIAKRIVELSGGEIMVESALDIGTTFVIFLPGGSRG